MFNDGALTPENGAAQWDARAQGIRLAMKAESARWGDHADSNPRTLVDLTEYSKENTILGSLGALRLSSASLVPVSYTHLTLPTKA